VGISRDYLLKTRPSKQLIGKIPGYEIIPSNTLALFGCTEMISGIELSDNSKFKVERK
jgi:hypothetical protein